MIVLGYSLAMLMGLTLGLLGAGGSILTVPILVYILGVKPVAATAYSLLVVGCTALVGAVTYWRSGKVYFKEGILFALPAMTAVLSTRLWLVPSIPDVILGVSKDSFIMILFSLMMLAASASMLRKKTKEIVKHEDRTINPVKLLVGSIFVGIATGVVGAGGGFLIIPSLIAIFGFTIKEAIGTSLAIIAVNSLVGFNGDLSRGFVLDWHLIGLFLVMTLIGVITGSILSKKIDGQKLKKIFGSFLFILGILILTNELMVDLIWK